jgi:hypothetical protein
MMSEKQTTPTVVGLYVQLKRPVPTHDGGTVVDIHPQLNPPHVTVRWRNWFDKKTRTYGEHETMVRASSVRAYYRDGKLHDPDLYRPEDY